MNEQLIKYFEGHIEVAQKQLNAFMQKFAEDPAHALSWSNETFRYAAEQQMAKAIVQALRAGSDVDTIISSMTDAIMHKSMYPAQSTSPTSNLIAQYELAAHSKFLREIQMRNNG